MMDDRFIRRLKRPRHPFNEISSAKGILFYFSIISGHFSYLSELSVEDALTHWDLQWNANSKSEGPGTCWISIHTINLVVGTACQTILKHCWSHHTLSGLTLMLCHLLRHTGCC